MPRARRPGVTPAQLIRCLITLAGQGRMFSDRIKGGRSIKVWDWDDTLYSEAMRVLSRHGYRVRKVVTPNQSTRLHVFEKNP